MHFITVMLFLAAATATNGLNFCPKIQEVDWDIELLLPHWKCNKFIQCTHGEPIEMSCPKGLYFSVIEGICDWKDNVDCGLRVIPDGTKPEDEVNDKPSAEDERNITEETKQPENNTTSDATPAPEDESNNIPDEIIQTEMPDIPVIEFLPNGCPIDPEMHWLLPHETFCNLFYYCVLGEQDVRSCPFRLHFNRELQICDWPRNVDCLEVRE